MPLLCFALVEITVFIVVFVYVWVNHANIYTLIRDPRFSTFSIFLEVLFLVPPLFYVRRYLRRPNLKSQFQLLGLPVGKMNFRHTSKEVLIGLGFGVLVFFGVFLTSMLSEYITSALFGRGFVETANEYMGGSTAGLMAQNAWQVVVLVIAMVLVVGPSEELLFRGFVQQGLQKSWGTPVAVVVTALMFTFAHVIPILIPLEVVVVFFLPYFVISLALGCLMLLRKNNILSCIVAHGFYNSLLIVLNFVLF
ncbi:MAG: lysostaphin resistance A-like protein [Promethearchaeota archaeon]